MRNTSARSKVTTISTSSSTMTSHQTVSLKSRSFRGSFEDFSHSPSRIMFLKDSSSRLSPGWVSGHASLFDSPNTPSAIAPKTHRSSVYTKEIISTSSSTAESNVFKKPGSIFISPTGVKTRARRSSIYQKSGKNLLTGLSPKSRRDSLAAIRSKKLVSESDYVFTIPKSDKASRKKVVPRKNKSYQATSKTTSTSNNSSAVKKSPIKKKSPPKNSTRSKRSSSPIIISTKVVNLLEVPSSNKSSAIKSSAKNSQTNNIEKSSTEVGSVNITITSSKKSSPLLKKSPTMKTPIKTTKARTKGSSPVEKSGNVMSLFEDNDDEVGVFSPRRTRKTPGKSIKRSLSSINKSAKKRKRSPSKSPSPAKKKKSPVKKTLSTVSSLKSNTPIHDKKHGKPKQSRKSTSFRQTSLQVSLIPLEVDDSFTLILSDSDKSKIMKTPVERSPRTLSTKKSPKTLSTKKSPKTLSTKKSPRTLSTKKSPKTLSTKKSPKTLSTQNTTSKKTPCQNSPKTPATQETPTRTTPRTNSSKRGIKESFKTPLSSKTRHSPKKTSTPKSAYSSFRIKSPVKNAESVNFKTSESTMTSGFGTHETTTDTTNNSPKSKTTLSTHKMKSILDSVTNVAKDTEISSNKRKITDFSEPQSANKRRKFDQDRFEMIVASTPRDIRLDILSGRRPELSPITGSVNKNMNNQLSQSKQVTIFSDKSTFLSTGPSSLSPIATSPLTLERSKIKTDFVDGNEDDYEEEDDFEYSHISYTTKSAASQPYLVDYDTDLDTSHSNVRSGCIIL